MKDDFYKVIGEEIHRVRTLKGYTLSSLARASGEQYHTVKRIELGERFSASHLVWVKDLLGIDIYVLFDKKEREYYGKENTTKSDNKKETSSIFKGFGL